MASSPLSFLPALSLVYILLIFPSSAKADFASDFDIVWGDGRASILDGGEELHLSMDQDSGSAVASKSKFLFGKFDVRMKLVPGFSAGTVTTFYLTSQAPHGQDEIDFEFMGNTRGDLYKMQTNIFTQGKGNREQKFHLWFDPTQDFHTYSILWNPLQIIMSVDDIPVRVFKKNESLGVAYVEKQALHLQASLWNGEEWATDGGTIKIDWTKAPFVASYRDFNVSACVWSESGSTASCASDSSSWMSRGLDGDELNKIAWAKKNYMIYNYCDDNGADESVRMECMREFS